MKHAYFFLLGLTASQSHFTYAGAMSVVILMQFGHNLFMYVLLGTTMVDKECINPRISRPT